MTEPRDVAGPREAAVRAFVELTDDAGSSPAGSHGSPSGPASDVTPADGSVASCFRVQSFRRLRRSGRSSSDPSPPPSDEGRTPGQPAETPTRVVGGGTAEQIVTLGDAEYEVLYTLEQHATRFEWTGATERDSTADILQDSCAYDRRVLLVTLRAALRRLAATTPSVSDEGLRAALRDAISTAKAQGRESVFLRPKDADDILRALSSEPVRSRDVGSPHGDSPTAPTPGA